MSIKETSQEMSNGRGLRLAGSEQKSVFYIYIYNMYNVYVVYTIIQGTVSRTRSADKIRKPTTCSGARGGWFPVRIVGAKHSRPSYYIYIYYVIFIYIQYTHIADDGLIILLHIYTKNLYNVTTVALSRL